MFEIILNTYLSLKASINPMSIIRFKLQESPVSNDKGEKIYYPVVVEESKFTAEDFCRTIHERCTLTEGEVWAVMISAAEIIAEQLSNGKRVELPALGTFAPSIVSDTPITNAGDAQIARCLRMDTIDFKPLAALMKRMHHVSYHRAQQVVKKCVTLTDEQLLEHIHTLHQSSPNHTFDRHDFQTSVGYGRAKACNVLRELTEKGIIIKQGKRNSPYYTLNTEKA